MKIQQQLDAIHDVLKRIAQRDDDLWTIDDIARYLKMSTRNAQTLTKHDKFPVPIRLPTTEKGSHPRWVAGEVKMFCNRFKTQ